MSCITEILKIKGDREIMPFPKNKGIVIEGGGEYLGYEYLITFTELGHRCGYVAITPDHPLYGKDEVGCGDLDVHGGITFHQEEHGAKSILSHHCKDEWLGFDAAHCTDHACMVTAEKYFGSDHEFIKYAKTSDFYMKPNRYGEFSEHRTYKYMEKHCKKLIKQLIEIKEAA